MKKKPKTCLIKLNFITQIVSLYNTLNIYRYNK